MTRRRRLVRDDRGMFTVELAAGLPALIFLLMVALTAVAAVSTRMQCLDAAREGAVAAARGDSGPAAARRVAPTGATITVSAGADRISVSVSAPVRLFGGHLPLIRVHATAQGVPEPEAVLP